MSIKEHMSDLAVVLNDPTNNDKFVVLSKLTAFMGVLVPAKEIPTDVLEPLDDEQRKCVLMAFLSAVANAAAKP